MTGQANPDGEIVDIPLDTDGDIEDEADSDNGTANVHYSISSYGADYDVEGLVKRLDRKDILIPGFQRKYVWKVKDASSFIESLLLGLPVPGIFLAREQDTNKMLVIDGQQRLKSLQFFFAGYFNPRDNERTRKVFRLEGVQKRFENKTYETLDNADRVRLNDSLVHATIIKQESPDNDNTSIYHVFDRLNSTGLKLSPQEIRSAIYHGAFIILLKELNNDENWRHLYGPMSQRAKDQELILRFFAMFYDSAKYERPMEEFLNKYLAKNKKIDGEHAEKLHSEFASTIGFIRHTLGRGAFRPVTSFNTAVFDSITVGIARRLSKGPITDIDALQKAHANLLQDTQYTSAISKATSDEANVAQRLDLATKAFENLV